MRYLLKWPIKYTRLNDIVEFFPPCISETLSNSQFKSRNSHEKCSPIDISSLSVKMILIIPKCLQNYDFAYLWKYKWKRLGQIRSRKWRWEQERRKGTSPNWFNHGVPEDGDVSEIKYSSTFNSDCNYRSIIANSKNGQNNEWLVGVSINLFILTYLQNIYEQIVWKGLIKPTLHHMSRF